MDNRKNKTISLRITNKQDEILSALCDKYGKSKSSLILFLIEKEYYFNKESDKDE